MNIRTLALLLYYFSLAFSSVGVLLQSIEMMAAGMLGATISYVMKDYFSLQRDSVSPMTINAMIVGVWWGAAHLLGYFLIGTDYEHTFYAYAAMDFLLEAQVLALLTVVVPLIAYPLFKKLLVEKGSPFPRIPIIGFEASDKVSVMFCLTLLAFDWANRVLGISPGSLGTLDIFWSRGSLIAIFLLSWHWFGPNPTFPKWTKWMLIAALAAGVGHSLMFSYMRGEITYPILMLFLALFMRKAIKKTHIAFALVAFPLLAFVYHGVGELREQGVYGQERIEILTQRLTSGGSEESLSDEDKGMDDAVMSLVARGCQFAQLSQVVRIADEDGFYNGETLDYLVYAFIPRIVWPEKPIIAPGQWFAEKIGKGQRISETRFSNSINMTLAGEFYLNFGWIGAVSGLMIISALYAIFWDATQFYGERNNPLGQAMGAAIIFQAISGSAAAAILNMVFVYIAMLAAGRLFIVFARRSKRVSELVGLRALQPRSN